jgi:hypothetical protein
MSGGMSIPDLLSMAASASLPQQGGNNPGGGMTTMGPAPLAMPTPLPQFKPPDIKYGQAGNEFSTVSGRKRADKEALFHGIASTIKSAGEYIQAKKNRVLQTSIENLMSAQQGIEEAKQLLQQNPNDPKAKQAIETNTQIINTIAADPKIHKQLEKAFNIDLFGNGKNKNENKALIDAWKSYGEKQKAGDKSALNPMAQRLMQSQAIRQQLTQAVQQHAAMIAARVSPDANQQEITQREKDLEQQKHQNAMELERLKSQDDLKYAAALGSQPGAGGAVIRDLSTDSVTGAQKIVPSKDGKTFTVIKNVISPGILTSEHTGERVLTITDPEDPTKQYIVKVPVESSSKKIFPNQVAQQAQQNVKNKSEISKKSSTTTNDVHTRLGLPANAQIISGTSKALNPIQADKLQTDITGDEAVIERLKDIRQYTGIYQNMLKAGKVSLVTAPDGKSRILGGFIPSTEEEKKATAAWQESAEYMNKFRQALSAQGFRSIPAYDNMLALRGQLWQDKEIMNKTLDDSISLMQKFVNGKKKLLGKAASTGDSNAPANPY